MPAPLGFPGWGPLGFVRPSGLSVMVSHYPTIGPSSLVSGGSFLIRLDRGALVTIEGFDDTPTHVDLDSQRFVSRDPNLFTVGPNPLDPLNRNQALILPTGQGILGTGTLFIRADGDPVANEDPLGLDVSVTIYAAASQLLLTYAIPPGAPPIPIPFGSFFELAMNTTARLQVQGLDDAGNLAALASQLFTPDDSSKFTLEATADPGVVIVHPVAIGSRGILVEADGDGPGPEVVPLSTSIIVTVTPAMATHIVASVAAVIP